MPRRRTQWMACGRAWDAVAITPMSTGLDALAAMRLGHAAAIPSSPTTSATTCTSSCRPARVQQPPVFPECACSPPATSSWCPSPSTAARPRTGSAPREATAPLVRADRLTHHLRTLTCPEHQKANAS
ncbi:hypothetical protein [Streptomyces sp. A 4/2]|uniref:hypothetical protein n=1 Tax=Streptomyces sp. A 4/2 TaxID=2934314 RepID=UPI0020254CA6|nr:hypothetical protein [Streptomyces sp. A 4/2]